MRVELRARWLHRCGIVAYFRFINSWYPARPKVNKAHIALIPVELDL